MCCYCKTNTRPNKNDIGQYNTTQRNAMQRNTTQRNTTQRNTTQRNTTQHNTTHEVIATEQKNLIKSKYHYILHWCLLNYGFKYSLIPLRRMLFGSWK